MTNTPNHEYNTPSEGVENWHIPLNKNFEKLDIDVEVRGKETNKGDFEPEIGTKYEATDSGAVYFGNGDAWVLADRRVGQLQTDTVSTKQIQNNGPRIVSPSIDAGYDSLQVAIDDAAKGKSSTIWVAENIKENVVIPRDDEADWYNRGLTIKGVSDQQTIIEDKAKDGQTPVITGSDADAQLHRLTLENLYITGNENSGPAVNLPKSCPFFTMVECSTDMLCELGKPFFGYFERCYFNSITSIETDPDIGLTNNTVMTDSPLILSGGNLVRVDRCTFRSGSGETNYTLLWLCQINNVDMNQPEFKLNNSEYNENAPRSVAMCLIDGSCGDINMNSPYCEGIADTQYRTARTSLTETGSPRAIYMRNVRGEHLTIDQGVAGIYIESDGSGSWEVEVNAHTSPDSYLKVPINTSVTVSGSRSEVAPRIIEPSIYPNAADTPALPSNTGESIKNPNYTDCLVYHNGSGASVHNIYNDQNNTILYGSPVKVPLRGKIYFDSSVPTDWTWVKC
ncbi:hypothetical protein EXE41_06340 [Halorubrum sp. SD690R]|uniref:hypothetical protein n=1 Tax=Halorubrum sp. SD690R TaxID=2518117 RepID=UPI0010F95F8C|nr:hypothetical protein [Halorubrum sp. SD690R]TKX47239.1 hypothetical protein EXE41_06340 [Halorubrum sp. SD690R]